MALNFFFMVFIFVISPNAQALVAKDPLDEDVAFELHRGEQPWLALLQLPGGVTCSGSIVSPTSLLSAAVCLQGATHPAHGMAYAGNVKYTVPKDFDPPTQNRSVVDYVFYNENNTLEYNIVLVKITPNWIWSISVQPVGVIDVERLPENFTSLCFVSGLRGGNDGGSRQVARWASVFRGTCARSPQPQDHRLCSVNSGIIARRAGDIGGPLLCDSEPEYKLYGILSEHGQSIPEQLRNAYKTPSRVRGFQFLGFYMSWINITAGDLPSDLEIKSLRMQHAAKIPLALEMTRLYRVARRWKRGGSTGNDTSTTISTTAGGTPSVSEEPTSEGAGAGNTTDASAGNTTDAGSGAGRACLGSCALPLLAALLALAVCALY